MLIGFLNIEMFLYLAALKHNIENPENLMLNGNEPD
jgi:hypothetical protein